ncbi:tetratricopeptide repeat protein [Inquilinus sp. CAU 1745]|uniref:tetratricopeptide repeat protein n=1 Tax=Inquilinus sp. CAU 1745 TaxID=3140369 RepID=UPI00325A9B16
MAEKIMTDGWTKVALTAGAALWLVAAPATSQAQDAAEAGRGDDPLRASTLAGAYLSSTYASGNGDIAAAAEFMAQTLARDPENLGVLQQTFLLSLASGDLDMAVPLAERVQEAVPIDPMSDLLLLVDDAESGNYAAALERAKAMPKEGVARFVVPLVSAWLHAGLKDRAAAEAALDELGSIQGFSGLATVERGLVLEVLGADQDAIAALETALEQGQSLRVIETLGALYARTGRTEDAQALFGRFMTGNPGSIMLAPAMEALAAGEALEAPIAGPKEGLADALFQIASALDQEGASDLALTYARMSLHLQPDMALSRILLGDLLAARGEIDLALDSYGAIDADRPAAWAARLSAARALAADGRTDEAIERLRRMAEDRPQSGDALVTLGDVYRSEERFEDAVAAYDEAQERQPTLAESDWTFLYRRGIALERAQEWARAEQDLQAAVALNPDHAPLLNYLGYSWIDRGENIAEAQAMIEQAVALMPDDGYIVDSLGWAYYRTGQIGKAVETLERAAGLQPGDPVINDHLGDAYWMAGRRNEAVYQWRRALRTAEDQDLILSIEEKIANGVTDPGIVTPEVSGQTAPATPDTSPGTSPDAAQ